MERKVVGMRRWFFTLALPGLMVLAASCGDAGYPFTVVQDAVEVFYETGTAGTVDVLVRNSFMATVRTLVSSEQQQAGSHSVTWDLLDSGGEYPGDGLYTVEIYLNGERISVQILEVNRQ